MRQTIFTFIVLLLFGCLERPQSQENTKYAMVIHGGAGTILKEHMTPELERAYRDKMTEALAAGYEILQKGGRSLDAVEAAITILEDSPLFNAGKGAVFTNEGKNELDASIMDGETLNAGAVASVTRIKNPIRAARKVMEDSPHVLLVSQGADEFARQMGLELVEPKYFHTERRWRQLQKIHKQKGSQKPGKKEAETKSSSLPQSWKYGTVGAVALDQHGHLAAGTSTGGLTAKRFGRVGDSPIIGAGTYADDNTCAISATGHGEYFIRLAVTHSVSAAMEYKGLSVTDAANLVIAKKLTQLGGTGGIIAIDGEGNIAMAFNTEGMYRGHVDWQGKIETFIYGDE